MSTKNEKKKQKVEKVRQFSAEDLPKDEDGKVILPDDITYAEFLKLTHPEFTERDLARAIRKEGRKAWVVRFQLLAILVFLIIIIAIIVGN